MLLLVSSMSKKSVFLIENLSLLWPFPRHKIITDYKKVTFNLAQLGLLPMPLHIVSHRTLKIALRNDASKWYAGFCRQWRQETSRVELYLSYFCLDKPLMKSRRKKITSKWCELPEKGKQVNNCILFRTDGFIGERKYWNWNPTEISDESSCSSSIKALKEKVFLKIKWLKRWKKTDPEREDPEMNDRYCFTKIVYKL